MTSTGTNMRRYGEYTNDKRRGIRDRISTLSLVVFVLFTYCESNSSTYGQEETDRIVFFSIPIAVDNANILANPSPNSYRTGTISKGRYVEVYFREANGYCAVRPPQGSFSWINGKFVVEEGDKLGKIVSPNGKSIPSRVGCESLYESKVVQIGLKNGQKIRILDKIQLSDNSVWYKIAPPPGEFRWIDGKNLVQDEAIRSLPSKLTFQSEYLTNYENRRFIDEDSRSSSTQQISNLDEELTITLPLSQDDVDAENNEFVPNNAVQNESANITERRAANSEFAAKGSENNYKIEVSKLNADVFQALKKTPLVEDEIKLLELRAETLFEAAPNDSERYFIQSLYTMLKKAENEARSPANGNLPQGTQPVAQSAPAAQTQFSTPYLLQPNFSRNPSPQLGWNNAATIENFGSTSFPTLSNENVPQNARLIQALDENGRPQTLLVDQNGVVISDAVPNNVAVPNNFGLNASVDGASNNVKNASPTGLLPKGYVSTSNSASGDPKKGKSNRMTFAFSGDVSPFSSKSKGTRIENGESRQRSSQGFSRLPSLFPEAQVIVPPQDYSVNATYERPRQNERLLAQARQKDLNKRRVTPETSPNVVPTEGLVVASAPLVETQTSNSTIASEAPQVVNSVTNGQIIANTTPTGARWRAVESTPTSQTNANIAPASSEVKKSDDSSKIKQTSAFTPVTIRTKDGFDAKGSLIATTSGGGAPRYALIDSSKGVLGGAGRRLRKIYRKARRS